MASFDQTGQPTGYDQIQPGLDLPKSPKPASSYPQPQTSPLQTAITQPAQYPGDPSMLAWRQGPRQGSNTPGMQRATSMPTAAPSPSVSPMTPNTASATGQLAPPQATPQPQAPPQQQDLSDPQAWMAMVRNPTALTSWVRQGLGPHATDDLTNYYVGKIQGQPGANETEQRGAADYWTGKLQNGGQGSGGNTTNGISPMQRALLFGNPQQQGQQTADLHALILQLLQQSTGQ